MYRERARMFTKPLTSLVCFFIILFSVGIIFSQTSSRDDATVGDNKTVTKRDTYLRKNGKGDNSYKVRTVIGDDDEKEYELTIERVRDPETGEFVTGVSFLIYRCTDEGTIKRAVKVDMMAGAATAGIICGAVGFAQVYYGPYINLFLNAATNGYSVSGPIVSIRGAEDPRDGQKLDATALLILRCQGIKGLVAYQMLLNGGDAKRAIKCVEEGFAEAGLTEIAYLLNF